MGSTYMNPDEYRIFFAKRLTQLLAEKNISANDMSRDLGYNDSYINHLENGQSLPSMSVFFKICDYIEVTPSDFFDPDLMSPPRTSRISALVESLPEDKHSIITNLLISWNIMEK